MKLLRHTFLTLALVSALTVEAQNLLSNASFEQVPNGNQGQGLMPSEWFEVSPSPDTYSNDGSYGLPPGGFGNFPGVVAQDGMRWVAGGSNIPESFAQTLILVPARQYTLSGWLHQALRGDLDNPGGYLISLRNFSQTVVRPVGTLGFTSSSAGGWVLRSFSFTAPFDAALLSIIRFDPVVPVGQSGVAYPGLDNLTLVAVPEPATIAGVLLGSLSLCRRRGRRAA